MGTSARGRAVLAIAGIAIAIVALGAILFLPPPNEMLNLQADLASAAAQAGAGGRVRLADVAASDWDRAYVFGAYTPLDVIAQKLDGWVPVSRFDAWLWGDLFMPNDGFALAVFVRGDHDVTGYRLLSPYEDPGVYVDADFTVMPRNSAAFKVTGGDVESGWDLTPTTE